MLWFKRQSDEQLIESLRKFHRKHSPIRLIRLFVGVMGILTGAFVSVSLCLMDRLMDGMPWAYTGFACGAMFGFLAMLMLLGGIVELMECFQKGRIFRTERLLLQFHDEVRSAREIATSPTQVDARTARQR